jgi:hypothetical protein
MKDTSVEWLVDLPLGREVIFRLEDDSGESLDSGMSFQALHEKVSVQS